MFPGQGAQQVGMGKDLAENITEIAQLYHHANNIVGYDLARLCFEGPQEQINRTEISQPAIFVTSAACLAALRGGKITTDLAEIQPEMCAGLSLGEYTALYAAGAMCFEDALQLVKLRGESMQQAAEQQKGSMVSVLGLEEQQAKQLCDAVREEIQTETDGNPAILIPVNFNCPGQIVLSGTVGACNLAVEKAESFGASRAISLQVAGAFHTLMMVSAAEKLKTALSHCPFTELQFPVVANVDAQVYDRPDQIPDKLLKQLVNPVLWQQTVEKFLDEGIERFIEIGPGRVLTGLVKKTARLRKAKPTMININGLG
jgi:[acyl-carrier-protein] S-malonyltransferase